MFSTCIRRLSLGGHVIIDDFHLPAVRTAVHEYREAQGVSETEEPLLPVPTHVETKAQVGQNDASRLRQCGAAPGSGQPQPISSLGRTGRPGPIAPVST